MLSALITNLWFLMTVSVILAPLFYVSLAPFFMSPSGLTRGSNPLSFRWQSPFLSCPTFLFSCHPRTSFLLSPSGLTRGSSPLAIPTAKPSLCHARPLFSPVILVPSLSFLSSSCHRAPSLPCPPSLVLEGAGQRSSLRHPRALFFSAILVPERSEE